MFKCGAPLLLFLLIVPKLYANEESLLEIFPTSHRAIFQLTASYSKDKMKRETVPFWSLSSEYQTKAITYTKMGGGYFQMKFPAKLYHFPTKDAVAFECKLRPDFGPIAPFLPLTMIDIGYLYSSKDWFTSSDEPTHSLMIGGWVLVPLKVPNDGIFMLSGSKSIAGTNFTRFSCYLNWFFTDHFGVTIHGDNFTRKEDDVKYHYGSFNLGVLFRI
jgi:hypothetical protein